MSWIAWGAPSTSPPPGAPLADRAYRSLAFVYAEAPAVADLEVTAMMWAACPP